MEADMKVVHKFKLDSDGSTTHIKLKKGYKIVHSEYVLVEKSVCIWIEQTLSVKTEEMEVPFIVVKSGDPIPDNFKHIASAVDGLTPEAYHIFQERDEPVAKFNLHLRPQIPFNNHQHSA